jgi:hypothetical protein
MRNWSPGTTGRRNRARSTPVNMMSLLLRSSISVSSSAPPAWAMASTISTPGMMGRLGKCPGKKRLVDGYILERHDALLALNLDHSVDEQKRKAVRQDLENIDDVERGLYRRRGCGRWMSGVGHFLSSGSSRQERRLYCTPTQLRNTARMGAGSVFEKSPKDCHSGARLCRARNLLFRFRQ